MKQVINEIPQDYIHSDQACKSKYYGIQSRLNGKGFILRAGYGDDHVYTNRSIQGMTYANGWKTIPESSNIQQYIKNLIKETFQVFEFETPQELFLWLAEK